MERGIFWEGGPMCNVLAFWLRMAAVSGDYLGFTAPLPSGCCKAPWVTSPYGCTEGGGDLASARQHITGVCASGSSSPQIASQVADDARNDEVARVLSMSLRRWVSKRGSVLSRWTPLRCWDATWLILPVVICLSQRLSHACLSMN
jgi:hypothetical protein